MASHKIKIRLPSGAEFEAEGEESAVQAQFKDFLELAKLVGAGSPPAAVKPTAAPQRVPRLAEC